MAKGHVTARPMARRRTRHAFDGGSDEEGLGVELEALLLDDEPHRALSDPDIGVDATAFYRWRRVRSEPPPPMGPSGSGLGSYKARRRS